MTLTTRWVMSDSHYGRSPAVCVDGCSRCWVAWISCDRRGESVLASFYQTDSEGDWSTPQLLVPPCRAVTGLAAAPHGDGILLAWTSDALGGGLKIQAVGCDVEDAPRHVVPIKAAPAHPAIASDKTGFSLFWTVRDGSSRCVEGFVATDFDDDFNLRRISEKGRKAAYPKAAMKNGTAAVIWQEMTSDASSVLLCRLDSKHPAPLVQMLATDGECTSAMPHIAFSPTGFWAAWQSDRDVDSGPELVRGIELLHLDDDGVFQRPEVSLPKIERRGKSEDQGFESPVLMCADDGHLIVMGRGSQSIRRLDLGASGLSGPTQIDEPGWQCRGRRVDAAVSSAAIWTAGREKDGITVRKLSLDIGVSGAPIMEVESGVPRAHLKAPVDKDESSILGGYRLLFGDIHQHTAASDGTGTMEETYFRARARYGDDVVAVTDHESFLGKKTFEGEWREACRIADEYCDPGSFVTLKGFEWTGKMHPGPGHKVVYLPAGGGPMLSRDDPKTDSSLGLLRECRALGALVVPHHVGWTGADMANHAPDVQTCWEIVSCHGAYERMDRTDIGTRGDNKEGQFIADALDQNLRFGFVGGSDGHGLSWHHGVSRKQDSHRTGLTGFLSRDVTREGVLEALRKRRCFATSGAKIAIRFEVDGRPMGEEVVAGYEVPFRVSVVSAEPILMLCLVTNGGLEMALESSGLTADVHGTLPPPPENGFSYYFVRLIQEDGETAWSSPIWLDAPAPA